MSEQQDYDGNNNSSSADDDGQNFLAAAMEVEVTAQMVTTGSAGLASAAAIVSSKKRYTRHTFETNPARRKRHQNRLLKKLQSTLNEFTSRVGQQAVILLVNPGSSNTNYKVFGAKPLEDVIRKLQCKIMSELENALTEQAPPVQKNHILFELPPLEIDGIPILLENMSQAQLRSFIPLMLKYSTGRGKPGWGKISTKPPWWPEGLPWANVRMDPRNNDQKQKISWTDTLRQIIINCYRYHGREDLLPRSEIKEEREGNTFNNEFDILQHSSSNANKGSNTESEVQIEVRDLPFKEAIIIPEAHVIWVTEDEGVNKAVAMPISESLCQNLLAKLHSDNDGTVYITPIVQIPQLEIINTNNIETTTNFNTDVVIQGYETDAPQVVLRILDVKSEQEDKVKANTEKKS